MERELTEQGSRLEADREQLLAERTRLQESVREVQGRLAVARENQSRSVRVRDQASPSRCLSKPIRLAAMTRAHAAPDASLGSAAVACTEQPSPDAGSQLICAMSHPRRT